MASEDSLDPERIETEAGRAFLKNLGKELSGRPDVPSGPVLIVHPNDFSKSEVKISLAALVMSDKLRVYVCPEPTSVQGKILSTSEEPPMGDLVFQNLMEINVGDLDELKHNWKEEEKN